jgi:hypothetical protein
MPNKARRGGTALILRVRAHRSKAIEPGFRARSSALKARAIVVALMAVLGALVTSVFAGIATQPTALRNAHPHLTPLVPPLFEFKSSSNNSSSNRSVELSSCFSLGGTYYCFPEEADWTNCFDLGMGATGPGCYDTWHFSVDIVVAQAPSSLGPSSSVYLWNGLENEQCWGLISGTCTLIQPVLEYYDGGISAFAAICVGKNGGGNCATYWNTDAGFTPSVGNTLELDIWDTSSGAHCWNVEVFDLTTGQSSGGLNDQCQNNWGWNMPIATFAMEDHNINPECPSGNYPYEPSSDLPLPVKSSDPGNWFYFTHPSLNSNILWSDDNPDFNCGWEATAEEPQDWEAFDMPS